MMRQPNPDQILEWKERRGLQSGPAYDIRTRIDELGRAWNDSPAPYLAEFIPMRIATCVEVYVREVIRELIDSGSPYVETAGKLAKTAKLDLVFAAHLTGQKLSIGDFVAHSVSVNSIDGVISSLSNLVVDFVPKVKLAHARWKEETENWPLDPIIVDYDKTISALAQMFEVRHVLTHELPDSPPVDNLDIEWMCEAASGFIDACDWVVVAELHGAVPRTQVAMNINAGERLNEVLQELESTVEQAALLSGLSGAMINETQAKWREFAELEASLIASQVEGGSMYPMLWSSANEDLVRDRISQLRRLIDTWME